MSKPPVVSSIDDAKSLDARNAAVTLGVFDGVHLGHRRILDELVRARERDGIDSAYVITFDPHPLRVTHSKMTPPMLTTIEERLELLSAFDIDGIVVMEFTRQLAEVGYRDFLDRYLMDPFDMKLLVLGYDCHFGRDREGSPGRLREEGPRLGLQVSVVDAERQGEVVVSSTGIRNALIEGDLARANRLLGHPYLVSGQVVRGLGGGKGLGFPTANLSVVDAFKLWPPCGVYAVKIGHGERLLSGMMNVGRAPTIKSLPVGDCQMEVHIFDFDEDIYGQQLLIHCHSYLRSERRFPSPEALTSQLEEDRAQATRLLDGAA